MKAKLVKESLNKYSLVLKNIENEYSVLAFENEKLIGKLSFIISRFKSNLVAASVVVDPNYRRQGIASSMYKFAEEQLKMKFIKNDNVLTADGKALWGSSNRNFG